MRFVFHYKDDCRFFAKHGKTLKVGGMIIGPSEVRASSEQGGILFWLCGNLRDRLGISPEIALVKNEEDDRKCI